MWSGLFGFGSVKFVFVVCVVKKYIVPGENTSGGGYVECFLLALPHLVTLDRVCVEL